MTISKYQTAYGELINSFTLSEQDIDYDKLENHLSTLENIVTISTSIISVFDFFRKKHAFYAVHSNSFLGYTKQDIERYGEGFMATKIHPDDLAVLFLNNLTIFKLYLNFTAEEKLHHKLINEYRLLNSSNKYVRVIEQHQALELDIHGNLWLALSILDVSPNQNLSASMTSQVLNFKEGMFIPLPEEKTEISSSLTQRETQILELIKNGLLSKEISDKLSISVHTVNTHRQRLLEKLGANNSLEAVSFASRLGLV